MYFYKPTDYTTYYLHNAHISPPWFHVNQSPLFFAWYGLYALQSVKPVYVLSAVHACSAEIMVNPSIRENPKDVLTGFPSSRHSNDTSPTSSPLNSVFSGSHHNHATTSSLRNPKSTSTDCSSPNANQVLPWRIKQENAPPL